MGWKECPVWDSMVRDYGNPFEDKVDKPVSQGVQSGQRKQPKRQQPRRKR